MLRLPKPKTAWGRWLKWGLIIDAVLVLLIVAYYCEERVRGELAWKKYQADARARGVKLTIAEMIPPPIPDEENFAAIPVFLDLFDTNKLAAHEVFRFPRPSVTNRWRGAPTDFAAHLGTFAEGFYTNRTGNAAHDVLNALEVFDSELEQVRAAASRPGSRFPVDWHKGFNVQIPHVSVLINAARLLRLRIAAELAEGKTEAALVDVRLGLRICRATETEPALISALVAMAGEELMLDAIHEGLAMRRWSAEQLTVIERALHRLDAVDACRVAVQCERVFSTDVFAQLHAQSIMRFMLTRPIDADLYFSPEWSVALLFPRGWIRQDQVIINRFYDIMDARIDPAAGRIAATPDGEEALKRLRCDGPVSKRRHFLVRILGPALENEMRRFVRMAAHEREALAACALERHRIMRGSYPDKLAGLVPDFVAAVPLDPVEGKPLRYERTAGVAAGVGEPGGTVGVGAGSARSRSQPPFGFVLWSPDLEHKFPELTATNAPPLVTNTSSYASADIEQWVWRQPRR